MMSVCDAKPIETGVLDLNALTKGIPQGAWIAISDDHSRVVAYGADIHEVLNRAKDLGQHNPLVLKVPEQRGALLL